MRTVVSKFSFTLIEMLIVVSILIILLSILTPSFKNALAKGQELVCTNNLRSIGTATFIYTDDYSSSFPWAVWNDIPSPPQWNIGDSKWLWQDFIYQYAPEPSIYDCPGYQGSKPIKDHEYVRYGANSRVTATSGNWPKYGFFGVTASPNDFAPQSISKVNNSRNALLITDSSYNLIDYNRVVNPNQYRHLPGESKFISIWDGGQAYWQLDGLQARHLNVNCGVFIDGHVESRLPDEWTEESIWKNDQ